MINKLMLIGISVILSVTGCSVVKSVSADIEQPNYRVISSIDNIEVRAYEPMLIAKVEVAGERDEAISKGFRLLADYIFGNNTLAADIAMTAPVQQQANQEIAMTAPVQQQASNGLWQVSFVMPAEYTLDTIAKPNNDKVKLLSIPRQHFAAIEFSGIASENNLSSHHEQLSFFINQRNIESVGDVKYAFYNPPWTLPFLRRNELMYQIITHPES